MTISASFHLVLAGLFLFVALLKFPNPESLKEQLGKTLGLSGRSSALIAWGILTLELALALGLVIPSASWFAALGAFAWCVCATVYWSFALTRSGDDCGCFGGADPLQGLGEARRFLYVAPFAILSSIIVTEVPSSAEQFSLTSVVVVFGLIGTVAGVLILTRQQAAVTNTNNDSTSENIVDEDGKVIGDSGILLSRRRFVRLLSGAVLGVAFVPAVARPAYAGCTRYRCVGRTYFCSCTSCFGGKSAKGCFTRYCRVCNGREYCYYSRPRACTTFRCSCGARAGSCGSCFV